MQVPIAHEMSKIRGEPTWQAMPEDQAANLEDMQVQDQQLAELCWRK